GREEEPAAGLPGGREGAAARSLAVEGAAGVGLRPGHRHAQAREAEPRAPAHRAVPVLFRVRLDQVERDDLLRDPHRAEEDWRGARRAGGSSPGEPGHRAGAEGRGERRAARAAAGALQAGYDPARRAPASRTVRRDGDLRLRCRAKERGPGDRAGERAKETGPREGKGNRAWGEGKGK